ncbi:MAG TPA: serine hydrolase [Tepidisphaeraceae bacterium]|nr:serine hydrolase [Tepidisphaeraceae bacterium]
MRSLVFSGLLSTYTWAAPATQPAASQHLSDLVAGAVHSIQAAHPDYNLKDEDIAVTLIDLSSGVPAEGSFRGDALIYPASVVKLFYLADTEHLLATHELQDTPELRRGLNAMIVNSDNDATAYILYSVTDAPNGAELAPKEMAEWSYKRNAVNRYFASLGYPHINVCQCPYSFGPFGRERIFLGPHFENRNALSTNATALLLCQIATHQIVSPAACDDMLGLLKRDMSSKSEGPDDQAHDFSARALTPDYTLYSKAGWSNSDRHDAAYIESPDGKTKFILATFTTHHARQKDIIPSIVTTVLHELHAAATP